MQSKVTGTAMVVSFPPQHAERVLVVDVAIDCPECGRATLRIPGHHLKAVRDLVQTYCDQFPELTGGPVQLLSQTETNFSGRPSMRPEDN
jgi:hypothetical protein